MNSGSLMKFAVFCVCPGVPPLEGTARTLPVSTLSVFIDFRRPSCSAERSVCIFGIYPAINHFPGHFSGCSASFLIWKESRDLFWTPHWIPFSSPGLSFPFSLFVRVIPLSHFLVNMLCSPPGPGVSLSSSVASQVTPSA